MASSSSSQNPDRSEIYPFNDFQSETSAVCEKIYDAFIHHRGPAVKGTLAFALYDTLEEDGLWTFPDDMESELGDSIPSAIQEAIYSSKVQIAIFTPRYAESSRCLNELLLMLETKASFIRIFCDVKPSDLSYPEEGVYAAALAKHEENGRFSKEKLDQWKAALHSSSRIPGYEFTTSDDNVEVPCTNIVSVVQQEVGKASKGVGNHRKGLLHAAPTSTSNMVKKSSLLPRYSRPVGLESQVEGILGLLEYPKVQVGKHHKGLQQLHISSYVRKILGHLITSITCRSGLPADADTGASTSTSTLEGKRSSLVPPRDSHPVLSIESKVEPLAGMVEGQLIAVVGSGGSGKTFLLLNVYQAVKSKYDLSIWLSNSKSCSVEELQHDIASHIGLNHDGVVTAELIHEHLQGKRCLLVLDDLWRTLCSENFLIDKLGLPADKDCKVVVTTRNRQVAINSGARVYEMKDLSDEDSWSLFCFYAFPDCVGNRAPEVLLEEEGRKIVKQCRNLPLAIKTIAASLANTTVLSEWELKRRQLEQVVTPIGGHDHEPIMEILKLSYDSLPAYLKPCFAYLSFFPEDEEITAEYLINLWIGEGFVGQWDMGWEWLDQLAQLCLLQLYKGTLDTTWYCGIHHLFHELAIHISQEDKCVFSVEEISTHERGHHGATGWHRILLANKGLHDFMVISENRPVYIRTLSLYGNEDVTSIREEMFSRMRGLRVLDLSWTSISTLPTSLGRMVLLRVLNLRETEVAEVPECVRHLKSLSFLALPWFGRSSVRSLCTSLPAWISELRCLQHLEGLGISRIPKGIVSSLRTLRLRKLSLSRERDGFTRLDNLVNIRTLIGGELILPREEDELMNLGDLVNMTQLEEVSINLQHEMDLRRTEEGILAQLVNMRRLKLENGAFGRPHLPEKMRAMEHLETLSLEGFTVPGCIIEFASLRELELIRCVSSVFPELQTMPNLEVLKLAGSLESKYLPRAFGKSGAFPKLRRFTISGYHKLVEFPKLEEGALASLQLFFISSCNPNMKPVKGLERLKSLEEFIYSTQTTGTDMWKTLKEGGKYWGKIKAINPNVRLRIMTEN